MRIWLADGLNGPMFDVLQADGHEVVERDGAVPLQELAVKLKEYDAIAVRGATKIPREAIDAAPNLLAIGRAGSGVNTIDVKAATEKGIIVFNAPGGNANAVAELAFWHMLDLSRKASFGSRGFDKKQWQKKECFGAELYGKTLGIVGLGYIGNLVAKKALGHGMKVVGFDTDPDKNVDNITRVDNLGAVLEVADFLSLHVPAADQPILNDSTLKLIKSGCKIINCARGNLVDIDEINRLLRDHEIGGYGADVFTEEPPNFNHPIFSAPNISFTPHIGANTAESQINCALMIAKQLADFLANGNVTNAVNAPDINLARQATSRIAIFHANRPGFIAAITQILGKNGFNISEMSNASRDGNAYTIVNSDSDVAEVAQALSETDGIFRIRIL